MLYRSSIGFLLIISMLVFLQFLNNSSHGSTTSELGKHSTHPFRIHSANSTVFQRNYPTAIIAGVKKGGTRALLEFLRLNHQATMKEKEAFSPNLFQIQAPAPEIHFFDRNYFRGLDWYRSVSFRNL